VLQKPSHKAVVNALGRRMEGECLHKGSVVHEKAGGQLSEVLIPDGGDILGQLMLHGLYILGGHRQIIPRPVFPLIGLADPLYV